MEKFVTVLERKISSNSGSHHLPNVVLRNLFLTAFTFKKITEYKQHNLFFLWQSGASGLSLRNCNYTRLV